MKENPTMLHGAEAVLRGAVEHAPSLPPVEVKIFLCATRADFAWETRRIWEETVADLQMYFLSQGLDIILVDPQQGLDYDFVIDPHTFSEVFNDMSRSCRNSIGPFLIFMVGDKLGPIPLPTMIEASEFELLRTVALETGRDVNLLDVWYYKDEARSPAQYRIHHIDTLLPNFTYKDVACEEQHDQDVRTWQQTHDKLLDLLQHAANVSHKDGRLKNRDRYFITGLEKLMEMMSVCPVNCLVVLRDITADGKPKKVKRKKNKKGELPVDRLPDLLDAVSSQVPKECILKYCVKSKEGLLAPCAVKDHALYLQHLNEDIEMFIRSSITKSIDTGSDSDMSLPEKSKTHHQEILSHLHQFNRLVKHDCFGMQNTVNAINQLIDHGCENYHKAMILYGPQGCGKSVFLCHVGQMISKTYNANPIILIRFIGITHKAKTSAGVLHSICAQLQLQLESNITEHFKDMGELHTRFTKLLSLAHEKSQPVVVLIDDLDALLKTKPSKTLQDEVKWILVDLPPKVHVIATTTTVSSNKSGEISFEKSLPTENQIEIHGLGDEAISSILEKYQITKSSKSINLANVLKACPLPLLCHLLTESALISNTMEFTISTDAGAAVESAVCQRLNYLEHLYGVTTVGAVLKYLSSTATGLTELEVQDVLSCNNNVIASTLILKRHTLLRFPYTLWLRIKADLGCILDERYVDKKMVVCLRHKIIHRVVSERYYTGIEDIKEVHKDVADLFSDVWVMGKPIVMPDLGIQVVDEACRFVCQQPLLYSETKYNLRRLNELWYQLLQSGKIEALKDQTLCNFEYLLAKLHGVSLSSVLEDLDLAANHFLDSDVQIVKSSILAAKDILIEDPLQLASELIGRLRQIKSQYGRHIEPLVQQAMDWCDAYHLPILVPLSTWLPDPRMPLVTAVTCPRKVTQICISRSGQHVFCATPLHDIQMYHVASGKHMKTFTGHTDSITCVAVANQKPFLLSASADNSLHIWHIMTGRIRQIVREHEMPVLTFTMTQADDVLVTGSKDCIAKVIHIQSGDVQHTCTTHTAAVTCVQLTKDDMILVTGSADKTVGVWYFEDMTLLHKIINLGSPLQCVDISYSNSFLLLGCEDGSLHVTALVTGTVFHKLMHHKGKVSQIAIASDSSHCVVGSDDGKVYTYNLCSGELLGSSLAAGPVVGVVLSSDDSFIFTAANDMVQVWTLFTTPPSAQTAENIEPLVDNNHTQPITCCAMSADGKMAITGSSDCLVKLWSMDISDFLTTLEGHTSAITCVALAENDTFAVSGSMDKTIKVWSIIMSCVITDYKEHCGKVVYVYALTDKVHILSADTDQYIKLWRAEDGETLLSLHGPTHIFDLALNSEIAISGDANDSSLRLWHVHNGTVIQTISHADDVTCVSFSPDSQYVVTGSKDNSLKVWEAATGKLTQVLVEHNEEVTCIAITDANRYVISGSTDKRVLIWNIHTGDVEHQMSGHHDVVTCVAVTQDSSLVISGSKDGTLRVWNINLGFLVTLFDLHTPVVSLHMTQNAAHIAVLLEQCCQLPLMCLHNTPAGEVMSQSQINIQLRSESPYLPLRPKQLLQQQQLTSYAVPRRLCAPDRFQSESSMPEIIKISPIKAPLQSTLKAQAKKRCEARSRRDKSEKKKEDKEKKSSICVIL